MPKAFPVKGLKRTLPLCQGAAFILAAKLPEVRYYQAAAVEGSIDGVHDMRVAAKRLREAVRVLRPALASRGRRHLLKDVEALNDHLGLVRDRDVIGLAYDEIMTRDARTAPLSNLRDDIADERTRHHRGLVRFLRQLDDSGFDKRFEAAIDCMTELDEKQPTMADFALEAVSERLQAVSDNQFVAHLPWETVEFHRQRIRVKNLKYALELFLTLMPKTVKPLYNQIAELQELMGLVHDCDVQAELVAERLKVEGYAAGLIAAIDAIADRRQEQVVQTRGLVARLEEEDVSGRLLKLLAGE